MLGLGLGLGFHTRHDGYLPFVATAVRPRTDKVRVVDRVRVKVKVKVRVRVRVRVKIKVMVKVGVIELG